MHGVSSVEIQMAKADEPKQMNIGLGAVNKGPNNGALIESLTRFGSLAKAGVQTGDEIVATNGKPIASMDAWKADLEAVGIGNTVKLTVVRGGQRVELPMKILEKKTLSLEVKALEEVLERKISP
jgi:S1-C subfamily serine protease